MRRIRPVERKPFPWTCPNCDSLAVREEIVPYTASGQHDNRPFEVNIPDLHVPKCSKCGELVFDRIANEHVSDAIRRNLGLLGPREISDKIRELGITHKQLAEELLVSQETLSRWISGAVIQSRHNDLRLRRCLDRLSKPTVSVADDDGELADYSSEDTSFEELWEENLRSASEVQEIVCRSGTAWGAFLSEEDA
jgi:transcriptional regulator with XRE-family HTH domain